MEASLVDQKIPLGTKLKYHILRRKGDGEVEAEVPIDRLAESIADPAVTTWIDIENPELDLAGVEALFRDVFHFHPLAIEDALRETHVPRIDDWGKYLYLVFQAVEFHQDSLEPQLQELDLFLGSNYLVSCHAGPMKAIECVRNRVERDPDRTSRGADHLLYQLLDETVSAYMTAIERLDEEIDDAQEEVFQQPSPATLQRIFRVKRAVLRLHRTLSPQREVLNRLARDTFAQVDSLDRVYFRDVYDHLVRLHDITESVRDLISGALDTYLSAISNRTNEIMKTLTLVTVMFLPMTFLAGFFGMNFFGENMVLLSPLPRNLLFWGNLLLMISTPIGLTIWAKRRGWI